MTHYGLVVGSDPNIILVCTMRGDFNVINIYYKLYLCTGLTINMEYFQATHLLTHKLRKLKIDKL